MHGSNPAKNFNKGGVSEKSGALSLLFERENCKIYYEEKEVCDANVAGNSHSIRVRHSLWAFSFYVCANET